MLNLSSLHGQRQTRGLGTVTIRVQDFRFPPGWGFPSHYNRLSRPVAGVPKFGDDAKKVTPSQRRSWDIPKPEWHHPIQACPTHRPTNGNAHAYFHCEVVVLVAGAGSVLSLMPTVRVRSGHVGLLWSHHHHCTRCCNHFSQHLFTGVLNEETQKKWHH